MASPMVSGGEGTLVPRSVIVMSDDDGNLAPPGDA